MAIDETRTITPPTTEDDVTGHGSCKAGAKPHTDQEPEVEGHASRRVAKPEIDSEVEGHGPFGLGKRQIDAVPAADEPEVEGHVGPRRRPPISVD